MTTNKIAEHAGESIGSLYQYFPCREAIINHLYEDTTAKIGVQIEKKILAMVSDDIADAITDLLEYLLQHFEQNELILINLLEEVPDLRKATQMYLSKC